MDEKLGRRRGVVLTPAGQDRLKAARRQVEIQNNGGQRFTLEELCDRTQLSLKTITKVLDAKGTVDRQTLEAFFHAFDLTLERSDYAFPTDSAETVPNPTPQSVISNSNTATPPPTHPPIHPSTPLSTTSWGEAIDVSVFYGREQDLTVLQQWIVGDRCRLVALLGMGGIGKSALSVKLAQILQPHFEFVLWRSLRDAPQLRDIVTDLLPILSQQQDVKLSSSGAAPMSRLMPYLRQHRCLIVLDNAETILQSGDAVGRYLPGYEDYGELLMRVGEEVHQSCLILTSREKPGEIAALEGEELAVRSHLLPGLKSADSQALFQAKGLHGSPEEHQRLIERYRGNPLALKIVATSIRDLFGGSIAEFLQDNPVVFSGIRRLLQQQCDRLSDLEQQVMTWLAIHREWVPLAQLQADVGNASSRQQLLAALDSLSRRCLIERGKLGFTQQPVVMEYQIETLLEAMFQNLLAWGESTAADPSPIAAAANQSRGLPWFHRYPLIQASAKEYVRQSQVRVILKPLAQRLRAVIYPKDRLAAHLQRVLGEVRSHFAQTPSYSAANLLHLMHHLDIDLTGYDFSQLWIQQAYLVDIPLHRVAFTGATFEQTVFAQLSTYSRAIAFSPDGKLFASADFNHLRLWEAVTGRLLYSMPHQTWTWRLAFSPDCTWLASGSTDNVVKIWDVASGQCLKVLEGEAEGCSSIAFSPDGRLMVGSYHHQIRIWETATWSLIDTLTDHAHRVAFVAIAPVPDAQGRVIMASSSHDQTVRVWDLHRRQCLQILQGHTNLVWHLTFSPDGQTLATGSMDSTIGLWDVATGTLKTLLKGHRHMVSATTFLPGTELLVSSSFDQTLKYWDTQTGLCIHTSVAHEGEVWGVSTSPDGQRLVSAGNDKTVKLWDSQAKQCIKTLGGTSTQVYGVAFASPDCLISSGDDEFVRVWDVKTGQCQLLAGHLTWVWSVATHLGRQRLATAGGDCTVRIWDLKSGQCLKTLSGHTATIYGLTWSADGQTLASCGADARTKLWDIATGKCLRTFEGHRSWVWSCALAAAAPRLFTASNDETLKIWDIPTGDCLNTLSGHKERIWAVALSPDDGLVVSGSEDYTAKVWDAATGECLQTLRGHTSQVKTVAFAPQGKLIATGGQDCTLKLWDWQGHCLQTLEGHTSAISSLAFWQGGTQDAPLLVSGSHDETIRLWDIASGQCVKVLRSPRLYEGMNLNQVQGLSEQAIASLQELGATL